MISVLAALLAAAPAFAGLSMGVGGAGAKRAAATTEKARAVNASTTTAVAGPTRLLWKYQGETIDYASPALAADGTVYFATSDSFVVYNASWNLGQKPPAKPYGLYAYNPNGTLKWKYTDGTDAPARGSPVLGPDGTIYQVLERLGTSQTTTTEELHAVTPLGVQKWKVVISTYYSQIGSLAPSVAPDGTIYVPGHDFTALDANGNVKWRHYGSQSTTSLYFASPAIAGDGTVYSVHWSTYGLFGQTLRALNPDGSVKWSSPGLGTYPISCAPSIAADGTIYLGIHDSLGLSGATNGALVAFSSSTGLIAWTFPAVDFDVRSQPSIDADGTIYIGTKGNNGFVYALNPDGTLKWSHATVNDLVCPGCGTDVYNTPLIAADGLIYVANELGFLYAFKPDGTLLWKDGTLGTGFTESSAAMAADGTLYIGTAYGTFMAVRTGSPGMSTTAQWPRFHYGKDSSGARP